MVSSVLISCVKSVPTHFPTNSFGVFQNKSMFNLDVE